MAGVGAGAQGGADEDDPRCVRFGRLARIAKLARLDRIFLVEFAAPSRKLTVRGSLPGLPGLPGVGWKVGPGLIVIGFLKFLINLKISHLFIKDFAASSRKLTFRGSLPGAD